MNVSESEYCYDVLKSAVDTGKILNLGFRLLSLQFPMNISAVYEAKMSWVKLILLFTLHLKKQTIESI